MRHLLTLVSLLLVGGVWADDFNFNSPRAKAAMEKYQYDKEDLLRDLEAALEHERTKGSLEEAIKIRDAIATLKQLPDAPVSNAQIPSDAVEWNGHYYWVSNEETTWHEANAKCEKMGGNLARIENQAKQEFISRFLKEKIKTPVDQQTKGERDHWVDGIRSPDGVWRFGNGAEMNYLNWFPYTGEQIEDPNPHHRWIFLGWPARDHYWANASADIRVGFICEWDGPADGTVEAKKIPADAVKYKGNYYKVIPVMRTYGGSIDYCENLGGHLATVEDAEENKFVASIAALKMSDDIFRIDGSDRKGKWLFSDGRPMDFFHWNAGEPNGNNTGDNCIEMYSRSGLWNDHGGVTPRYFICEWEGAGPQASHGVFLDDLQEREFSTIYGEPGKHGEANKKAFLLYDGVKPSHSLFIHPPGGGTAFVRYDINGDYKRLKTKVGLAILGKPDGYRDSSKKSLSPVLFKVYGDDKLLWESKPIQAFGRWLDCDVSIAGVNNLRLTTEALGSNGSAHATWIMPELKPAIKNGSKQSKTRPEEPIKKLSPKHAKRILDDANLWEGKPGVWFLKRANNFSGRTYERLSQSNRIRSALASVNGRLPTPDEMNNPPSRR